MFKVAHFYRRSEKLFEGTLSERLIIALSVDTAGHVRTTGTYPLRVRGITSKAVDLQEIITQRLSTTEFSYINFIEPSNTVFIGSVSLTDEGGSVIPINRKLYSLPVEIVHSYLTGLRQSSPFRSQEEIGITPVDNATLLIIRFEIVKNLKIGDRVVIENETMVIRNIHKLKEAHWQVQTILKSPV
jgi:hypothetical protein